MKRPVALIDLDNTLAEYDAAMRAHLLPLQSPTDPPLPDHLHDGTPYLDARMTLIKCKPGFWSGLKPIPMGFVVLDVIREEGFRLSILTRGPKTKPLAWAEKVEWAAKHVPDAKVTVTTDEKSQCYGRLLFDDFPPYIEPWLEHRPRGLVLMLDRLWNRDFSHERVIRITPDIDLYQLRMKLREVANR